MSVCQHNKWHKPALNHASINLYLNSRGKNEPSGSCVPSRNQPASPTSHTYIDIEMETTRSQMMQDSALSELDRTAEIFAVMLEKFEKTYPDKWQEMNEQLYSITEMNIADLANLLQVFSEIAK